MITENNNENVCPSCKHSFESKGAINRFINNWNRKNGGDGYRGYRCPMCGKYHLTTTVDVNKKVVRYNRSDKRAEDTRLLRLCGLA